jgi:hypothetical protein
MTSAQHLILWATMVVAAGAFGPPSLQPIHPFVLIPGLGGSSLNVSLHNAKQVLLALSTVFRAV